jgi:hypothetical protein
VTRSVNHRPSIPIGRPRVDPGGTKSALGSLRRTLAHSFSPLPLPRRSESLASESEKATALLRAPSPARVTTEGWMRRCRAAPRQVLHLLQTRNGIPKSIEDRSFPHDDDVSQLTVVSPSTHAAPCEAAATMAGPEPATASGGSRSTHATSGSIHCRRWWPRGQHKKK